MKIGFVTPWFGWDIPGGAEAELRGLLLHIKEKIEVEVLTTCVEKFSSDWNVNYQKPGKTKENGIVIRRFPVRQRDVSAFDAVNYKLMNNIMPLSANEEETYIREMINSPKLYSYIRKNKDEYSLFVFIPYMFGTTFYGISECPEKAVLIPCFHDESYAYMNIFKNLYKNIAGMIFHAQPELVLAEKIFDLTNVKTQVLGEGVYTDLQGDAKRFRDNYNINDDFILYAGRKDAGKNVDVLLQYFEEYKRRNKSAMKLVLIGGGCIEIPETCKSDIIDLGFVPVQDKYDAYAAAMVLCQPSTHESFSLVIMESWLSYRPVMVHEECAVTKNFAIESNGGLYFKNYFEFEGCLNYLLQNKDIADCMGNNGRNYVMENFAWDVVVDKYCRYFLEFSQKK